MMSSTESTSTQHQDTRLAAAPETLPLDGFSRWRQIARFIPYSRETARLRELEGRFPRRIRLTQRCSVWSNRELHRFMADPIRYRADDVQDTE
ncbi:helix-turn-helix transcriptional regulator [Caballeronia sp. KNU42]